MGDAWSTDPDRMTRRDDTRTTEQALAETFAPTDRLAEAIIASGKAWDVAREAGLTVLWSDVRGGHVVALYAQPGTCPRVFADAYASEADAYRAIFTYMRHPF